MHLLDNIQWKHCFHNALVWFLSFIMSSPLDARDREILEHLHQAAGGDIQALCDLLGVTRTAIRQRIARLEGAGLISSELQGQSRGLEISWRI